jgi:hypothetical protein
MLPRERRGVASGSSDSLLSRLINEENHRDLVVVLDLELSDQSSSRQRASVNLLPLWTRCFAGA